MLFSVHVFWIEVHATKITEDFCACVLLSLLFTDANVILTCGSLLSKLDLYTCVSPCESVGLGCYWVDNSELRKRKRTSLWHLLTLVTLLDFPLQLYQPGLDLSPPNSSSVTAFSASHRWAPPCLFSATGLQSDGEDDLPSIHLSPHPLWNLKHWVKLLPKLTQVRVW